MRTEEKQRSAEPTQYLERCARFESERRFGEDALRSRRVVDFCFLASDSNEGPERISAEEEAVDTEEMDCGSKTSTLVQYLQTWVAISEIAMEGLPFICQILTQFPALHCKHTTQRTYNTPRVQI